MKSSFPEIRSGIKGVYQVKVVEPAGLPALRRRAAAEVGVESLVPTGTVNEWENLGTPAREIADCVLGRLVTEHPELVDQPSDEVLVLEPADNLILDQGLNQIANTTYSRVSTNCAIGTGTDPVYRDSGTITVTIAAGTATASAPFFVVGDTGRLLRADTGEETYLTYSSNVTCTVSPSVSVAGQQFTIWYVNQVGLGSEVQRTGSGNYLTGTGNCGSSRSSSTLTWKRTYDGRVESGNQNYTELGFSSSAVAGNNLWSRVLISGGTVSVLIGQRIRVIYSINIVIGPITATAGTSTITGWAVAPSTTQEGDYQWVGSSTDVGYMGFSTMGTNGEPDAGTQDPMGPNGACQFTLATNTSIPSFAAGITYVNGVASDTNSLGTYAAGSFHRTKSNVWGLSSANRTDWRAFGANFGYWMWVWDESQTKDNLHTLTITLDFIWSRTLTNP